MPLPKPREDEDQSEFISRCMDDDTAKEDYPDREQRLGVCFSQWRSERGDDDDSSENHMSERYYVRAQGKEAEILIYEDIGEGWFGGISAKQFAEDLKALGKVDQLNVRINSVGGSVFEGVAIYNQLRRHQARVEVDIDGIAASIASVIAMAGDVVRMADNGFFMIHRAWGMALGTSEDMEDMARQLEKIDGTITDVYAKRTKVERDEVVEMLAEETWMNAAEALEHGFVDEVTGEVRVAAMAHRNIERFGFRHVPEPVREAVAAHARPRLDGVRGKIASMEERLRARRM